MGGQKSPVRGVDGCDNASTPVAPLLLKDHVPSIGNHLSRVWHGEIGNDAD
jgi:hypothetical protein